MPEEADRLAVVIDREACMGSGQCLVYAPATFAHDADAVAVLLDPPHDPPEQIHTAIEACPMSALSLRSNEQEV